MRRGDQQVGAAIVDGRVDFVIFFWDPLEPQPHDVDVKALLRVAVVHNVPIACNRATADFLLSSPLMHRDYERMVTKIGRPVDLAPVSYTHLRAHETPEHLVCRLLLEKKKKKHQ